MDAISISPLAAEQSFTTVADALGVIPALVAGIQLPANAGASWAMDPGHKARDDSDAIGMVVEIPPGSETR
jgi:hypothetical protein